MRKIGFFLVFILAFSALASPVRVSLPPLLGALPVALGVHWGFFAEEGLEVELVPLPSQRDRILAFQAGQIDAMITDLTSAILLVATDQRAVIVGALYVPPQDGSHLRLITAASYSKIFSFEELLKRLGERPPQMAVPRQSDLEYAVDQLFAQNGLRVPPELYIGQDNLLVNATWALFGMVPVAVFPQPYVDYILNYQFEGKPELLVLADFAGVALPPDVLVMRRSLGEGVAQGFLRASSRAVEQLRALSREELVEEATPLVIDLFFPGVDLTTAKPEDRERVEQAVDALRIPSFSDPAPLDPEIFAEVAAWARAKGYLTKALSYEAATWPLPG